MNTEFITETAEPSGPPRREASPALRNTRLFGWPLTRTVLLLALTTAYLFPLTHVLYPVGDDGTLLYGAQRVSEGAVPGRDFLEIMGPGSFYWLGLFFKLFGAGWQVSRIHLLFTGVATAGLLYAIARQVCRESTAFLVWLFILVMGIPLWPAVSHHWDSNLFAIFAVWCYLRLEKTEHPAWAVAAGSLAAITACFIQQKGFALLLGLAASATLRRLWSRSYSTSGAQGGTNSALRSRTGWSALWLLFGSFAAVGVAVLAAFWWAGALRGLLYSNFVWPLSGYHDVNAVPYGFGLMTFALRPSVQIFGANWPIAGLICVCLSFIPFLVLAILPLLSTAPVVGSLFFADRQSRWTPRLAITLAGTGLWLSEMHRRDVVHFTVGSPLLLIALFATAPLISKTWAWKVCRGAVAAGLVVFGTLNFLAILRGSRAVETRRGTVMSVVDDQPLRFLTASVKEREYVFIYPYSPIYYYLANVRNPTRFSLLLYGYNTPGQFDEVIRNLEEKHVRYVFWDTDAYGDNLRQWFPGYQHPPADKLKLEQYLEQRYEVTAVSNGFRLLQRRAGDTGSTITGGIRTEHGYHTR